MQNIHSIETHTKYCQIMFCVPAINNFLLFRKLLVGKRNVFPKLINFMYSDFLLLQSLKFYHCDSQSLLLRLIMNQLWSSLHPHNTLPRSTLSMPKLYTHFLPLTCHTSWRYALCFSIVISFPKYPNIFLNTLFLNILHHCSSFSVRDLTWHSLK